MSVARRMVLVTWIDSAGRAGWSDTEEGEREAILECHSIGWLLAEHEDRIIVAQSIAPAQGKVADTLAIPRTVVSSLQPLRRGR